MHGITDIFIQNTSGLPYVARCYKSEICLKGTNHSLINGFFAAIESFKGELGLEKLRLVSFDELSLVFEGTSVIMVIVGVENQYLNLEMIQELSTEICRKFIETHGLDINDARVIDLKNFEEFIDWLDERVDKLKSGDIVLKF